MKSGLEFRRTENKLIALKLIEAETYGSKAQALLITKEQEIALLSQQHAEDKEVDRFMVGYATEKVLAAFREAGKNLAAVSAQALQITKEQEIALYSQQHAEE